MGSARTVSRSSRRLKLIGLLAAAVFAMLVLMAPAALAYPDPPPSPSVDANVQVQVAGARASTQSPSTGGLAFTGSDTTGLVVIGGVLIGAGTLALVASRRRANHALRV